MSRAPNRDAQVRDLERVVARQPESRFFAALAEAYLERGEPGRAIEVCERGLRGNPGFIRGLIAYARALVLAGNLDAGRAVYAQARAEHPRESSIATAWGTLLAAQGLLDEARSALTEALRVNPLDVDARHALAALPPGTPARNRRTAIGATRMQPAPPTEDTVVTVAPAPAEVPPHDTGTLWSAAPPPAPPPARAAAPPPDTYGAAGVIGAPAPAYAAPGGGPQLVAASPAEAPPSFAPQPPVPPQPPAPPPRPVTPGRRAPPGYGGSAQRPRRAGGRTGKTVLLIAGGLCAVIIGVGGYLRVMNRRVASTVAGVDALVQDGSPQSYRDAEERLTRLLALHPRDGRLAARLAAIAALRAMRFDGGSASRTRAEEAVRIAEQRGDAVYAAPALALLRIAAGDAAGAATLLGPALQQRVPGAALALGLAEKARGRLAAAEEQLALAWSTAPRPIVAGCELAAVQRRRGRLSEARATLDALRAAAPQDLCTRLEALLLLRQSGGEGTRAERDAAREAAAPHPALRARALYADALVAEGQADATEMRRLLGEAVAVAPWEPEYLWAYGRAELLPGGDARKALAPLGVAAATAGLPEAQLDLAAAQLLAGRAAEAAEALAKVEAGALPATQRGRLEALRLTARHELLQHKPVHVTCAAAATAERADDDVLLACALVAREERAYAEVRRLAGRISRSDVKPIARGLVLLAQGDPTGAAESLGRAAEGHVETGAASLLLAEALTAGARDEQARVVLRRAVTTDAQSARTRVALAGALAAAGQREEAARLLDAVLAEKPTSARLACRVALAFAALGDPARGEAALRARPAPEAPYYSYVAGLLALAAKAEDRAQQALQAAAAADTSYAEPRFVLAQLAAAAGRVDDATARYDAAVRPSPEDPYLRLRLAVAQAEAGYGEEAERSLEVARKGLEAQGARGLVAEAWIALARAAAAGDAKRAQRADWLYEQAMALAGAPAVAFYRAGRYHEGRRDLKAAVAEYRAAAERDPQLAEAHLRLGLLLAADRKLRDEAPAHLRAYLKLLPDGEHAERVKAELKRLGRE